MAGYIPRWFTRPQTVTHPGTNRVWRSATTLIEANALPLSQTAKPTCERRMLVMTCAVLSALRSVLLLQSLSWTRLPSSTIVSLDSGGTACRSSTLTRQFSRSHRPPPFYLQCRWLQRTAALTRPLACHQNDERIRLDNFMPSDPKLVNYYCFYSTLLYTVNLFEVWMNELMNSVIQKKAKGY